MVVAWSGVGLVPLAAASSYDAGRDVCRLTDDRLGEVSGLVAPRADRLVVHNDSGDRARFFVLDRQCRVLAEHRLTGATNRDWEDAARGRDERGAPVLWFADVGDNGAGRSSVTLWRVPEPTLEPAAAVVNTRPTRFDLRYPDGAHDVEALLVDPPTGRVGLVTKSDDGAALYLPDGELRAGRTTALRRAAGVELPDPGAIDGLLGGSLITGGAVSPTGDRLALRTYRAAFEWPLTDGDFAAAVGSGPPTTVALPSSPQGEAIAYDTDGRSLLVASERTGSAVTVLPQTAGTAPDPTGPSLSDDLTGGGRTSWILLGAAAVTGLGVLAAVLAGLAVARRR